MLKNDKRVAGLFGAITVAALVACGPAPADSDDDDSSETTTSSSSSASSGTGGSPTTTSSSSSSGTGGGGEPTVDLGDVNYNLTYDVISTEGSSSSGLLYTTIELCLNEGGSGDDYLEVRNLGDDSFDRYFEVVIGVFRASDGDTAVASNHFYSDIEIAAGDRVYWNGPFCTMVGITHEAGDTWGTFAFADSGDVIDEADEENNLVWSTPDNAFQ
jgi:hypothetical protein